MFRYRAPAGQKRFRTFNMGHDKRDILSTWHKKSLRKRDNFCLDRNVAYPVTVIAPRVRPPLSCIQYPPTLSLHTNVRQSCTLYIN